MATKNKPAPMLAVESPNVRRQIAEQATDMVIASKIHKRTVADRTKLRLAPVREGYKKRTTLRLTDDDLAMLRKLEALSSSHTLIGILRWAMRTALSTSKGVRS